MEGLIKLLNVGDGDAIIVHLNKSHEDLVVVVDGGKSVHYKSVVKPQLTKLLNKLNKPAPDIVVATHYDSDHIGGLIPLVEDYIAHIKEVWVHRSPELNEDEKAFLSSYNNLTNRSSYDSFDLERKLIKNFPMIKEEDVRERSAFFVESLRQLETFLGLLPADKVKQVFHGSSYPGWPEIKVLGPTREYYESLFPTTKKIQDLIIEEMNFFIKESQLKFQEQHIQSISSGENPCKFLKDETTAKLTPTNKASIIIAIDAEAKKRYLLTADAGIESFKMIPDWKTELKDLFWLKIPHHGSNNNISREVIEIMKPVYADNSGDRYQSQPVLDCISRNARSKSVRSTKTHGQIEIKI